MKKNILIMFTLILLLLTMTGCNVKFIEKAPPKEESSVNEDLGEIIYEESSKESSEIEESSEPELPSITEVSESSTDEESSEQSEVETEDPNIFKIDGYTFNTASNNEAYVMYAKENLMMFSKPSSTTATQTLKTGTLVEVYGVSTDERYAMFRYNNGPIHYALYSSLTFEYIEPEKVQSQPEQSQSESSSQPEQSQIEPPQVDLPKPEQSQPQQPQRVVGGISYPSSPSSTSINIGVTFADETFTATVLNDGSQLISGPGPAIPSTGYSVIESFSKNTQVKCTGIGKNGYIRIELANGRIGFMHNEDLKR